jgi:DNA-binding transcriptional MerR regulator
MRISELARRSGIPLPTIKYYFSAGLLPRGVTTSRNQASYGERHLYRLRLVRVLREMGGLTVGRTLTVIQAVEDGVSVPELIAVLDAVLPGPPDDRSLPDGATGVRHAAAEITDRRFGRARPGAHARTRLVAACAAADLLEVGELGTALEGYAEAAARFAETDAAMVSAMAPRSARTDAAERVHRLERVTAAVVLGVATHSALCALAREDRLNRLSDAG